MYSSEQIVPQWGDIIVDAREKARLVVTKDETKEA